MNNFWSSIGSATFENEASVETRLISPLLEALGYEHADISPKHRIIFQEGRAGRPCEADFVVFYGQIQNRQTSLIVVEAKRPGESFDDAKAQAESYTSNMRAPIFLVSDGNRLMIWQLQLTMESECVFDEPVTSLLANRGRIESLLSKAAMLDYCISLTHKTLLQANTNFGIYINNELLRASKHNTGITRTLTGGVADSHKTISSTGLLDYKEGAVITGPSGFGKSTLAQAIYTQALESAWKSSDSPLPFDVPLPELVESKQGLLVYLTERLSAHCPFVTENSLKDALRDKGAILICDGFDRVIPSERLTVQTTLGTALRDFPKLQLFVFSRWNARPKLPIPTLRLDELSDQQQNDFRMLISLKSNHPEVMWQPPGVLAKLCWHPLLLQLITNYLIQNQQMPKGIAELFESWLSLILEPGFGGAAARLDGERALSLIATATVDKPLTTLATINLLSQNGILGTVYDALLACDAIVAEGRTVELQHESLADYLRALAIISLPDNDMCGLLSSVDLRADSLFPILLMSMLPTRPAQRQLWGRLAHLDLATYFNALRFQSDVSSDAASSTFDVLAHNYLEDILDGLVQPLEAFFNILSPTVIEVMTGSNGDSLAITGTLSPSPAVVGYQIGVMGGAFPNRINVGKMVENYWPIYGCNLDLLGQRTDNGREIGAGHLHSALLKLVKMRKLAGGPTFINERVIGRLRLLKERFGLCGADGTLESLEKSLGPIAGQFVAPEPFGGRWPTFSIMEVIQDIQYLRRQGMDTLDQWWLEHGGMKRSKDMTEEEMRFLLNEHYRRVQLAYAEVAKESFGRLAQNLKAFPLLPARWDLRVLQGGLFGATVYFRWLPTEKWDEAGADVEFVDNNTPQNWDFEADWAAIISKLSAFGRPTDRSMGTNGFRQFPLFDGNHLFGSFDGETSVMREAMELLSEDIKMLFKEIPSSLVF